MLAHQGANGVASYTAYMHLSSVSVRDGQNVRAGATLGLSGDTGNASGTTPHLHFEIWTSLQAAQKGCGLSHRVNPTGELPIRP